MSRKSTEKTIKLDMDSKYDIIKVFSGIERMQKTFKSVREYPISFYIAN